MFTEDEISRFHFIDEPHPAAFSLIAGYFNGTPVSILCWIDEDSDDKARPVAIILADRHKDLITFDNNLTLNVDQEG